MLPHTGAAYELDLRLATNPARLVSDTHLLPPPPPHTGAAYELDLRLAWEGEAAGDGRAAGELRLPYISEENADEDPEVQGE